MRSELSSDAPVRPVRSDTANTRATPKPSTSRYEGVGTAEPACPLSERDEAERVDRLISRMAEPSERSVAKTTRSEKTKTWMAVSRARVLSRLDAACACCVIAFPCPLADR